MPPTRPLGVARAEELEVHNCGREGIASLAGEVGSSPFAVSCSCSSWSEYDVEEPPWDLPLEQDLDRIVLDLDKEADRPESRIGDRYSIFHLPFSTFRLCFGVESCSFSCSTCGMGSPPDELTYDAARLIRVACSRSRSRQASLPNESHDGYSLLDLARMVPVEGRCMKGAVEVILELLRRDWLALGERAM